MVLREDLKLSVGSGECMPAMVVEWMCEGSTGSVARQLVCFCHAGYKNACGGLDKSVPGCKLPETASFLCLDMHYRLVRANRSHGQCVVCGAYVDMG